MKRRNKSSNNSRQGTVAVLSCFLMIALLGMVAFAVDLGYMANGQTELQRAADAAALAACAELRYGDIDTLPGSTVNMSANVADAPTVAGQYAAANKVCGSSPALAASDIVVGYMANPGQPGGTIETGGDINNYNAVQVTVRRSSSQNGLVPAFFSKVFGQTGETASATSTAAFIGNFSGFGLPSSGGGGSGAGTATLMFLPYALDLDTWNALLAGTGNDNWRWNPNTQTVTSGCDGILECNLFPQGTGSPGNRGTVCIGGSGTSTLVRQIQYGLSAGDLQSYGGSLTLDSTGNLYLPAKPGISAGTKSALAAIIGQTRVIPVFSSITGNGANAEYDIVQFVGVRVLDVNLTGSMSSKHLTVQPAWFYPRGGIAATPLNGSSSSAQYTYGVYSPVWLVK
jgi:Flp pilus assembly protein TadG